MIKEKKKKNNYINKIEFLLFYKINIYILYFII